MFNTIPFGIIGLVIFVVLFLICIVPYCYVLFRLISKAWYKSKNEEKKYE